MAERFNGLAIVTTKTKNLSNSKFYNNFKKPHPNDFSYYTGKKMYFTAIIFMLIIFFVHLF
jgi:hypothetical protein